MSPISSTARNKNILTPKEVSICKTVAELDIRLLSLRAQALLLMHSGYTQADTAAKTGLSIGQVRYLMIIFKKKGINIFPKSLLDAVKTEKKPVAPADKPEPAVSEVKEEVKPKEAAAKKTETEKKIKAEKKKKKKKEKPKETVSPKKKSKKDKKKKDKKKKKKK